MTRIEVLVVLTSALLVLNLGYRSASANGRVQGQAAACLDNLRRLSQALTLFAADQDDYLPGNVDDGSTAGYNWVAGIIDGSTTDTNTAFLLDPRYARLGPYAKEARIYRCPADLSNRLGVPRVRTCSLNQAVGTQADGFRPVHGPWLDDAHGHQAGLTYRTYARFADMVDPPPGRLFTFIDEHELSINDGGFGMSLARMTYLDHPAVRHDLAGTVAFADGHVVLKRWTDPRTLQLYRGHPPADGAGSPDLAWLQTRTSAPIRR